MLDPHLKSPVTRQRLAPALPPCALMAFSIGHIAKVIGHDRPGIMRSMMSPKCRPQPYSSGITSRNRGLRIIGGMRRTAYRRVRARADPLENDRGAPFRRVPVVATAVVPGQAPPGAGSNGVTPRSATCAPNWALRAKRSTTASSVPTGSCEPTPRKLLNRKAQNVSS